MFQDILVATDGSEYSEKAGNYGIEIAKKYNSRLHILSIISLGTLRGVIPEILENLTKTAKKANKDIKIQAKNHGIKKINTEIKKETQPSKSIIEYIENNNIDIVVMGTRGRKGLEKYLIGNTTQKVMRKSNTPILSVPKKH